MDSAITYIAYASGFATGIYVGMRIEERLAVGKVILRIITTSHQTELINLIKNNGFGITVVDAQGARGAVNLIFTVIERKDIKGVIDMIHAVNSKAFYTIENVRHASDPYSMDFADDEAQMTQGGWMTRLKGVKK